MGECIFCAIADGRAPSTRVYEDERTVAFMDINPMTEGHTLVIPRAHAPDLWSIGEDDASCVMRTAVRVAGMIRSALEPEGINMLQATGAVAFQTVFHFHVHLVPRNSGDGVRVAFPRAPGDPARLEEVAALIRGVPTA